MYYFLVSIQQICKESSNKIKAKKKKQIKKQESKLANSLPKITQKTLKFKLNEPPQEVICGRQ